MPCHRAWYNKSCDEEEEIDVRKDFPVEDGDWITARDGPEEQYRGCEGYR